MRFESRRDHNEKEKAVLQFEQMYFLYCSSFWGWSLGFAFQRWFEELEKALIKHFTSLKMEKNWKRSVKVFGHRKVFDDGPVYITQVPKTCHQIMWNPSCYIQRAPTFQLILIYLPTLTQLPTYLRTRTRPRIVSIPADSTTIHTIWIFVS
jgi:hypothetical protein